MADKQTFDYDYIIIGSGFGGSVAALRLSEKGYRVLVIEKGKWLTGNDFPKTNWNLKRWLWLPALRFFGLFKITFFRHITVLSGAGVGGGSLVYANTLPVPKPDFFQADTWAHLADWQRELAPHYATARRMLGVTKNPTLGPGDRVLEKIAADLGGSAHLSPTEVAVFFGEPGTPVSDPYFGGSGPERVGCVGCGACMTGCRIGAKNSLDKNYLYLAEWRGARVEAETEVHAVRARRSGGYDVCATYSSEDRRLARRYRAARVVLAAGVTSEMGDPNEQKPVNNLVSYSGIIPRVKQSGGPEGKAYTGKVAKRCNSILKNYVVQSGLHLGLHGPDDLMTDYKRRDAAGQHADFGIARRYLRMAMCLMRTSQIYMPPQLRNKEVKPEDRAGYYLMAWPKLREKWDKFGALQAAFAKDRPLGQWRNMIQEIYGIKLTL